ncbi:MAG TPA: hypothetical protein VH518_15125 [Tepidisphaeraceae bacterium]|jgi:hypothetical protein
MSAKRISLSATIDAANAMAFWNRDISTRDRAAMAGAIAATRGQVGAYANTFALSARERKQGVRLFTGERVTNAAARHITGEEGCRALLLLGDRKTAAALKAASAALLECLRRSEEECRQMRMGGNPGCFCCGPCTASVWRHITAGGLDRHEERLTRGLARLRQLRRGEGKWQYFPFWYTVSALVEMDIPAAAGELKYVEPSLTRAASRKSNGSDDAASRRSEIARRALTKL